MEEKKIADLARLQGDRKPITLDELDSDSGDRIYEISREFSEGFKFIKKYPKSVTFFGSTRYKEGEDYYEKTRSLAKRIVEELGYAVVTGGGPGIMEAANRGALEAKGDSLGFTIKLPEEQVTNDYLSDYVNFYYFFSRKVCLTYSSEAFIFAPGGFGTLDEFFEIITLLQTRKIPYIPAILYGSEYWNPIKKMIQENLLERGTIDSEDMYLFEITDDEDKIIHTVKNASVRTNLPYSGFRVNPIEE